MAMRSPEICLHDYLQEIRLEKFEQSLRKQKVSFVSDLTKIDQSTLISEVGMTSTQAKRIARTMREMILGLEIKKEIAPAPPPKSASLAQNSATIQHKPCKMPSGREMKNSKIPMLKIRCKFLDRQGIFNNIVYPVDILHLVKYYEFVHQIYEILSKEKREINFTSVELYTETGCPLAPTPNLYLEPLSNWKLQDNELIYAYPKKLWKYYCPESNLDCEELISIQLKDSNIRTKIIFNRENIYCFDLKIRISLDMHILTDCISIHYFNLKNKCEEVAPDDMSILKENIGNNNLTFTISETYVNNEIGIQLVNASCFPSSSLPKFHTLNADIQELVREYSENRDKDKLLRKLGLLKKISYSPPLVHALYFLFTESPTSLPHRIAINEGIITTIHLHSASSDKPTIFTFTQLWRHIEEHRLTPDLQLTVICRKIPKPKRTQEIPRKEDQKNPREDVSLKQETFITNMHILPLINSDIETHNFLPEPKTVSHPPFLICPITEQLFENPVMTPDGNTYEHKAILEYIERKHTDPLSNSPLLSTNLRPNRAIADAIFKYRKKLVFNV